MSDPTGQVDGDGVEMTPTQLNEVIEEKLTHLKPAFENLLGEMVRFKEDLSNGKIHWKDILDRAKSSVGWEVVTGSVK